MNQIQTFLRRTLDFSILAVFFFVPWWLRPLWMPRSAYFMGFIITLPLAFALVTWLLLGAPGIQSALNDARRWWIAALAVLVGWVMLSPQWSDFPSASTSAAQQFAVVALFGLIAVCAGPSARSVAVALAMGVIFQAVIVVAQVQLQEPVGLTNLGEFEIRPFNRGLSIVAAGRDHLMRPYGLTIHPNVIGGYFTVAILCMAAWLVVDRDLPVWRQAVRFGIMALTLWGLCLTFSRSAWGALVIGLASIIVAWWRRGAVKPPTRRTALAAAGAILIAALFGISYSKYVWARAGVTEDVTEQRSISDRRVFIGIALQVAYEHPILGVGIGAFPWVSNVIVNSGPYRGYLRGDNVHDVPLLVTSELGLVGLALWLITLAIGLLVVWRQVLDPFATGLAAGVVALLAIGVLDHYPWSVFHFGLLFWGSLGIALRHARPTVEPPESS
jgi:O-antigen ligase